MSAHGKFTHCARDRGALAYRGNVRPWIGAVSHCSNSVYYSAIDFVLRCVLQLAVFVRRVSRARASWV